MKRVSVKLPLQDWKDLWGFVKGDTANMEESCPIKHQMEGILKQIQHVIALNEPTPPTDNKGGAS